MLKTFVCVFNFYLYVSKSSKLSQQRRQTLQIVLDLQTLFFIFVFYLVFELFTSMFFVQRANNHKFSVETSSVI